MCKLQYLATCSYVYVYYHGAKHINLKQNIQKNRLKIKELPERKIGEKKSKIGSSLFIILQIGLAMISLQRVDKHNNIIVMCEDKFTALKDKDVN